jgi:hypothetical protein
MQKCVENKNNKLHQGKFVYFRKKSDVSLVTVSKLFDILKIFNNFLTKLKDTIVGNLPNMGCD